LNINISFGKKKYFLINIYLFIDLFLLDH